MDIIKCLQKINPNVGWSVNANDYAQIICSDANTSIPTMSQLESAWQQILAEQQATEYQRLRAAEYPPAADYLDAVVKGDEAQKQAYIDKCLQIKQKYPKNGGV